MLDVLALVVFACGVVYLAMHIQARRVSRALQEAKAGERRFRDLTELSADWFWETDASNRITWISGGAPVATFFGGTPTYGKRFWEIPGVRIRDRVLETLLVAHLRLGHRLPHRRRGTGDRVAEQVHRKRAHPTTP